MVWSVFFSHLLRRKGCVTGAAASLGLYVMLGWQAVSSQTVTSAGGASQSSQTVSAVVPSESSTQLEIGKGPSLAKSKQCLGCHQIDTKRVGPAFLLVAQRHGDSAESLVYIAGAIRQGGRGRWGAIPMPAQPQVSESESRLLAQWILSLKP